MSHEEVEEIAKRNRKVAKAILGGSKQYIQRFACW